MKVLLLQEVPTLGRVGEVKEVAEGYYRNFLLPRKLATAATESAMKRQAQERRVAVHREEKATTEAHSLADQIKGAKLLFKVKVGEQLHMYGAITAADVAEELKKVVHHEIDKRHVELEDPIRHLGTYEVPIRVGKDVVPKVTVVVEKEEEAAE